MNDHAALDEVLGDLPSSHVRARCGLARLVLGCNGGFVVVPGGSDVEPAARLARQLVDQTRDAIAEHLSLVPFLDALVVERSPRRRRSASALLVAIDLLPDLLVQGPPVVAPEIVGSVRDLVLRNRLGAWLADGIDGAGRIDLCDPQATTSPT